MALVQRAKQSYLSSLMPSRKALAAQQLTSSDGAVTSVPLPHLSADSPQIIHGDARRLDDLSKSSIDLIVTSPPYWRRRDYGHPDQLGQEKTPEEYVAALVETLNGWKRLLRRHASVFINLADTFSNGFLAGIPARFEIAARDHGWRIANHIVWTKTIGVPEARPYRLARRHEVIYHLTRRKGYFFDLFALSQHLGKTSNPGNVWQLHPARSKSGHLAPFPPALAQYTLLLACPQRICSTCGRPFTRILEPTADLDTSRQQARRALEIYEASSLTEEHLAAIRAVGISDAGKGRLQQGATRNAKRTVRLAEEAKAVLGGYFREFTFAPKRHVGWQGCKCNAPTRPGTVLDPFMGKGTTLQVAQELGRNAIGVDLKPPNPEAL